MKDEKKTKAELIKELKTLRKEREKSVTNNTTKRKQAKGRGKQPITEMDFLYKTALNFVQLDPKDDIYRFIGRKLKEIVGNSIVLVTSYDKASESFYVRALEGVGENIKHVLKIIGKDLFTRPFPANNKEARNQLVSGELLKISGGLYELSFGHISKSICYTLENFLNVGEIYISRFTREKELFGNITIIVPKGTELNNREFINTFIKQAAIVLQKKQAEEELKDSEERLKILFDYAPDAYYINDLTGKFLDGNKAAERLTGYKKEELIGKSFLKLKLLSMGQATGPDELVLNRKDNSKVTVEIFTYPVKIKGRTLVLGIARDITERREAEKALAESEEKYRTVFENTGTATLIIEEDTIISMVNTQFEKLSGYSKDEIENKIEWTDFVIPEDLERMKKYHIARRKAGEKPPTEYEFRIIDKKGNVKDIFLKVGMIPNTKKSIASLTDITERKRAGEELRLHAAMMDNVVEGICLIGLDDLFIKWTNEKFARMFGYVPGEMVGKHVDIINAPTERAPTESRISIEDVLKETGEWHGEVRNIKRDGTHFWCYVNVSLFDHPEYGMVEVSVNTDITKRKKTEQNIKNAKDELQMIMDSVPAIIVYKDTESRFIRVNKTLANRLKIPVKDIVNKTTKELFPKEQAEKMRKDDREVIVSGKPKRDIIQPYDTPDGTRWVITDKIPYQDKKGKIIGVICLSKDITVQRKSEQELQQSYQRLKKTTDAAIDTMSRIIEAKDPYTSGHQRRVCQLAVPLAQELGLSQDKIEGIRIAALIHDIGKVGLPAEILSKPIKLTEIEFSLIKNHSQTGYDILKSIDFPYPIARIVLQHHERLDGSGYPNNLKGDEILLEAKIIGVADVVEAISSHRPYRPALGTDAALEEISKNKGILYDPKIADVCIKLFKEKGFKFE